MNKISQEQKSNLAKLLATENINVIHQKVETAYFIPKTRTLCLPIWEEMSNDLYDLLVGHEVGHALYTPQDFDPKKYKIPPSYFNVVEDIRIDKKMKIKYPGLRKSYYNGYNELAEKDFFMIKDKDVNGLRFIDRLNIHNKSGTVEQIIFNEQEQEFITRSKELNTWSDVVSLVKDIYDYSENEEFDEEQQEELQQQLDNMSNDLIEGEDEEQSQSQEGQDEEQKQGQENSSSSESDDNKSEDKNETMGASQKEGDQEKQEQETEQKTVSGREGDYKPENISITDEALEQQKKSIAKVDDKTKEQIYLTLPKCKSAVVPYEHIKLKIDRSNTHYPYEKRFQDFKKFKQEQMRTVNLMVKEFEMKKAADNYIKTRTARTGVINTNALHSYKYNDDIFARMNIEPGAKNHGMVMIIDWSGSMGDKMYDTIVQTMNLVMFCKAVNIPFSVYAFSDHNRLNFSPNEKEQYNRWQVKNYYQKYPYHYDQEGQLILEDVSLLNFVNSDMKTVKYNEAMANLFGIAKSYMPYAMTRKDFNDTSYDPFADKFECPHSLRLGGTPLDSAIYQTINIVNEFQAKHKIQKMNTIFLTDGSGHTSGKMTIKDSDGTIDTAETYHYDLNIKDGTHTFKYGGRKYGSHFQCYHRKFLEYFKLKTGSTVIGYYIAGKKLNYWDINCFTEKESYQEYDNAKVEIRKNKVWSRQNIGYDELFVMPRSNLRIQNDDTVISSDMSASRMKQIFSKGFKQQKMSRVFLNKFIERVA